MYNYFKELFENEEICNHESTSCKYIAIYNFVNAFYTFSNLEILNTYDE